MKKKKIIKNLTRENNNLTDKLIEQVLENIRIKKLCSDKKEQEIKIVYEYK